MVHFLTVFFVVEDFEVTFFFSDETLLNLRDGRYGCKWSMEKGAERRLLHHFRSAEAAESTEIIRAVNDAAINRIRISQYVTPV